MNTKIKRLSFTVNVPDKCHVDNYVNDALQKVLEENEIWAENVLNIIESEEDEIYTIIVYYKRK